MNLFEPPAPRWFTIGSHRPFLADLAEALVETLRTHGLGEALVLLPTRRAGRALAAALADAAPAPALLLPQIRALGDLDEAEAPFEPGDIALDLPPAIDPQQRRFELAGMVAEHADLLRRTLDAASALDLADALAGFLDACQIEERCDPDAVEALVGEEFAEHWKVSARFLKLALEAWPARLARLGLMDIAARRTALTRRLAQRWIAAPPKGPVVAAGSTGSTPAGADLLVAIAAAPRGCVVLPGLDLSLSQSAWLKVGEEHPQGALARLLARAGVERDGVRPLDARRESEPAGRWRRRVINEALRPPEATADWLPVIAGLRAESGQRELDPIQEGLRGLSLLRARDEDEAAALAALLMRETLESPHLTCALVTPDVDLARRASAHLTRWAVTADVSAGRPLAAQPGAVLATLAAKAIADPDDPISLLALSKHPLTRVGLEPAALASARRLFERHGSRGIRPDGWRGLMARLEAARDRVADNARSSQGAVESLTGAIAFAVRLRAALAPAEAAFVADEATAAAAARGLAQTLESLCAGPGAATGALWAGDAGEALATLLSGLMNRSAALPGASRAGFAELLEGLLGRQMLRSGAPSHPRLRILGVLEARLIHADRWVLAGLEEGVWPAAAPMDPFLSRPMRERLGLPPPERRIGLSAHDFAQAAAAPQVAIIECERRGGAPAVASRWLWRLRTLARGADVAIEARPEVIAWARALNAPIALPPPSLRPAARPNPKPPLAARPRVLPVTAVERWVRDPYGFYAQRILALRPLDLPDAPMEAMVRGSAVHKAFERFAAEHPGELPPDPERRFCTLLVECLREAGMPAARLVREQALASNLAPWVIAFERRRRQGARLCIEAQGSTELSTEGGTFTLTARADRIEVRGAAADVLDLKTGAAPSQKVVEAGLAPQLSLTAAIVARGGFADIGPRIPRQLLYVRVSGGRIPAREEARDGGAAQALADRALAGLRRRIRHFDDERTGYLSWAAPQFIRSGGDYDHLARVWEWRVIGESGAEAPA